KSTHGAPVFASIDWERPRAVGREIDHLARARLGTRKNVDPRECNRMAELAKRTERYDGRKRTLWPRREPLEKRRNGREHVDTLARESETTVFAQKQNVMRRIRRGESLSLRHDVPQDL